MVADLLQVLAANKSTGTPTGWSYYSERCARRAKLKVLHEREQSTYEQARGTAFHKLMELYHTGRLENEVIPVSDADPDEDPIAEALRLFAGYRAHYDATSLGRVIGCEIKFPADDRPEQAALLTSTFGVPYTGQIDMVVEVVDPVLGLDLLPGFYIVDYKTVSKRASDVEVKHQLSGQFASYCHAWNTLVPGHPVMGTIVQEAAGLKKLDASCFRRFFIPAPNEIEIQAVKNQMAYKAEYLKTDHCNLDACTDWNVCGFYKKGLCLRV